MPKPPKITKRCFLSDLIIDSGWGRAHSAGIFLFYRKQFFFIFFHHSILWQDDFKNFFLKEAYDVILRHVPKMADTSGEKWTGFKISHLGSKTMKPMFNNFSLHLGQHNY